MTSGHFNTLKTRIQELRRLLLPSKLDPTGTYLDPDRVMTRSIAFRVLAHAELETYFEDRVIEVAKTAEQSWSTARHVSTVTLHLLGFSGREMGRPPNSLAAPNPQKAAVWPDKILIDARFGEAVAEFVKYASKENHGIRERNLLALLLPIAFDVAQCDAVFLAAMDQFGQARGFAAHSSGSSYVSQGVDPKDELQKVQDIVRGLVPIDAEIDRLLAAASPP